MGNRVPPRKSTDMQTERAGASSLLQLLDKLYVGGLPSAEPEAPIDQTPKPPKKLPSLEEEEERIDIPQNIMGSP